MSRFCELSLRLLLGDAVAPALEQGRVVAAQCISGTGGLHLAARMLQMLRPGSTVHLPAPTWPIHPDIFTEVGLAVAYYPYYDARTGGLDFDEMLAALEALPAGSVVLLHACAHNPTGVDPTAAQWARIAQAVAARALIPLVDAAYQGLASGDLDADAAGARALASVPGVEMITVQSYSKNMGLYAERAGLVSFTCQDAPIAERLGQQLRRTIRLTHSSPPQHGAALVATILGEPGRSAAWRLELAAMAARLHAMRRALHDALVRLESPPPDGASDWRRVLEQRGMFTYTGLSREQARAAAGGLPFPPSPYSSPVPRPPTPQPLPPLTRSRHCASSTTSTCRWTAGSAWPRSPKRAARCSPPPSRTSSSPPATQAPHSSPRASAITRRTPGRSNPRWRSRRRR